MSYQPYGAIYGFGTPGQSPQSMAQPFAFNQTAAPTQYAMPTAEGLSSFGEPASGYNFGEGAGAATPNAGGGNGWGTWLKNGNNLGTVFQGISALTNAYLGFQQLKQAKEGLRFQKDAFNTNLVNSTQSYNTSLEDRIRGRTSQYAGKEQDVQSYLDKHSLDKPGG